jgi:hypothetical protein
MPVEYVKGVQRKTSNTRCADRRRDRLDHLCASGFGMALRYAQIRSW